VEKEYHSGNHCKYLLKAHLILVVKYRKKLLVGDMDDTMKQILFEVGQESDFVIESMETDKDHVHFLLDYPPKFSMSSMVNRLKSMSTNRIWKAKGTELKTAFWKENTFWHDGYFCCSTGDASTETIRKYIEEQG
jgi:putative transposase